jgi:hypothetical protein
MRIVVLIQQALWWIHKSGCLIVDVCLNCDAKAVDVKSRYKEMYKGNNGDNTTE